MKTNTVTLKVNHTTKEFALLDEATALDEIVFNDYDCRPDTFGDVFVGFVKFEREGLDLGYEFYRSCSETYLEEVAQRIVGMLSCGYTDVTRICQEQPA